MACPSDADGGGQSIDADLDTTRDDGLPGETCTSDWIPVSSVSPIAVSSEDDPIHPVEDAFDTRPETVWHTIWRNGALPPPHEVVVDLGGSHAVDAISYLPRQDPSTAGTIVEYALYLSDDAVSWGEPVLTGEWPGTKQSKVTTFEPVQGRFARLVALRSLDDNPVAVVAELGFRARNCVVEE
jgi:endo-alpha-N-acetylgalactosaminidase